MQKLDARATFDKAKPGDAGWDLTMCSAWYDISCGLWVAKLGVIVEPPPGHFLQLVARSSLAILGWQLANSTGIIDAGYRGEWCALLIPLYIHNLPTWQKSPSRINLHDGWADKLLGRRICQAILLPHIEAAVAEATPNVTERGASGFGSTG